MWKGEISDLILLSMIGTSMVTCDGQIGWFTCDGAAVNGTTIRELEKEFDNEDLIWKARDHDIL